MAANEWRRRADPLSAASENSVGSIVRKEFHYRALEQGIDCMRFVKIEKIEPTENEEDPTVCTLVHMAFGERPKFETLSYLWGDERTEESIILDGVEFPASKSLRNALGHLRNQEDIQERNRQLPMMSHTYFKASTVVIWLRIKYLSIRDSYLSSNPTSPVTD
jgi:Heterokaryon incompatibility protein (HET)